MASVKVPVTGTLELQSAALPRSFTAQPYPLFLGNLENGQLLIGRIIGWDVSTDRIPVPVVVFDGGVPVPIRVDIPASIKKDKGRIWIKGSVQELHEAAGEFIP